jgi:hypothetical protein
MATIRLGFHTHLETGNEAFLGKLKTETPIESSDA